MERNNKAIRIPRKRLYGSMANGKRKSKHGRMANQKRSGILPHNTQRSHTSDSNRISARYPNEKTTRPQNIHRKTEDRHRTSFEVGHRISHHFQHSSTDL